MLPNIDQENIEKSIKKVLENLLTKNPVVRLKSRAKKKDRPNKRKLGGNYVY